MEPVDWRPRKLRLQPGEKPYWYKVTRSKISVLLSQVGPHKNNITMAYIQLMLYFLLVIVFCNDAKSVIYLVKKTYGLFVMNMAKLLGFFAPKPPLQFAHISAIYRKNGHDSLKLVSKMAFKKWNINIRLEHSAIKKAKFRSSRKFSTFY